MQKRITILLLLCLFFLAASLSAWEPLALFDGPNTNLAWQAPDESLIRPVPDLYNGRYGLKMDVQMSGQAPRFYRDGAISLDLSPYTEFSFSIRVSHPEIISRCVIYFKSGSGWYAGWFTIKGGNWQTINLQRDAFAPEDNPVGWKAIDGVRLAFGKAQEGRVQIEVSDLRARSSSIAILRNSAAANALPQELGLIDRSADRLRLWLDTAGIHAAVLDDCDIKTGGIPPGIRLAILPYNPVMPPETLNALQTLTAHDGKLMVIYALPPELASGLGLSGKQWMKPEPKDRFTSIAFSSSPARLGLPLNIRQNSWNANVPNILDAETIGTWINGNGENTQIPAVTIGRNGVFIGHILTNIDRERKTRMLLALSARLVPDLMPLLTYGLRQKSELLFNYSDWSQTRQYIMDTAAQYGKERATAHTLKTLDLKIASASTKIPQDFDDLYRETTGLKHLVRQAYFESVGSSGQAGEMRGVWCHNAAGIPGESWPATVRTIRQANFNVLFANHQWAGTAYYPSVVLPVSHIVKEQGDLLQQALDACRREGVAFHLWSVLWVLENAPDEFVAEMEATGRLIENHEGQTLKWLCPANPLNMDLAVRAAAEVVQNYAVDGFHLDYVRYPDGQSCFCSNCKQRFQQETGRKTPDWPQAVINGPDREAFLEWRKEQISTTVERIHREIKTIRPSILLSAAVWSNWPSVGKSIGQDWVEWCRSGLLDFVCPMNYVTSAEEAISIFSRQQQLLPRDFPIYPGIAPTTHHLTPEETVRQVTLLRQAGAGGFVLFELDQDLQRVHLPALGTGATAR